MGILSGRGILSEMEAGRLLIEPFNVKCINPNSVDLHLSHRLLIYEEKNLIVGQDNPSVPVDFPDDGLWLRPGVLYIGSTVEYTETHAPWVPILHGKSSLGRLGLCVHATAGFGDHGFKGDWTLELHCVQPVRVFPGMKICQISYTKLEGDPDPYNGRYQNQRGPTGYIPREVER